MLSKRIAAYISSSSILAGSALSLWVCRSPEQASIGLTALIVSPWIIATGALFVRRYSSGLAFGTTLMLAFELFSYREVFVFPQSSTAALLYVVKPFWQLFGCLPLGFLIAWLTGRSRKAAQ